VCVCVCREGVVLCKYECKRQKLFVLSSSKNVKVCVWECECAQERVRERVVLCVFECLCCV